MSAAKVGSHRVIARTLSALAASALAVLGVWGPAKPPAADRTPVIVQAGDLAAAAKAVRTSAARSPTSWGSSTRSARA